jgi:hypothetical protein
LVTVATFAACDDEGSSARIPYALRSLPQSHLLLHSLLRSLCQQRRKGPLHLVSDSTNASTTIFGVEINPEALSDSEKLTQILA